MKKYEVRLSKENGSKLFTAIVEAEDEKKAFLECVRLAEEKGINVPNEVWHSVWVVK